MTALAELHRATRRLGATVTLSSLEGLDGRSRPRLLAVVVPAPSTRWGTQRLRLKHGTTLASCDLQERPDLEDAACVLLDVLAPLLRELQRREAA